MVADQLPLKRPVSVWNRPLGASPKSLFTALAKVLIAGVAHRPDGVVAGLVDAAMTVKFTKDLSQVGWTLVWNSLCRALDALLMPPPRRNVQQTVSPAKLAEQIATTLDACELVIDRASFFKDPRSFPLLRWLEKPLAHWLTELGVEPPAADVIVRRLPGYFVTALHEEWAKNRAAYAALDKWRQGTPFDAAAGWETAWRRYHAGLQRRPEEPIFDEVFGLAHVYVPLRAYFERCTDAKRDGMEPAPDLARSLRGSRPAGRREERVAVWLASAMEDWLSRSNAQDPIRLVAGGPGSGKSTFATMFAAQLASKPGWRVVVIPLHRLDLRSGMIDSLEAYFTETGELPGSPFADEAGREPILLVFDGLDELSMQGRGGLEAARTFVREVRSGVDRLNTSRAVRVLITGRTLAMQAAAGEPSLSRATFHVLPFHVTKAQIDADRYVQGADLLEEDQRDAWWRQYGALVGTAYDGLPKELEHDRLGEVTAQPLLNYLVALSHRRGVDLQKDPNLNLVYSDLLQAVYDRPWGPSKHPGSAPFSLDQFLQVLEEIAVAAWHGDGRTTTIAAIEERCCNNGLEGHLTKFEEGARGGVVRLLTAFYFRQRGQDARGAETFEFTHKSFGEYLAARRVVRELEVIVEERARRAESPGRGWTEEMALTSWLRLTGPTRMDQYLYQFLTDEIELRFRGAKSDAAAWQKELARLLSCAMNQSMPVHLLNPRGTLQVETGAARNADEALLAAMSACALVTKERSVLDLDERRTFGEWLSRMQGQRLGGGNTLAYSCLHDLAFEHSGAPAPPVLHVHDIYHACFDRSDIAEILARYVNGWSASFIGANLQGAFLPEANLQDAILQGANLQGANLHSTNLNGARLEGANLEGAILERANLRGANLDGANLAGCYVTVDQLKAVVGTWSGNVIDPAELGNWRPPSETTDGTSEE